MATASPAGLPPYTLSVPAPAVWAWPSATLSVRRWPGALSARRPTANRAGRPAPKIRPTSTTCPSACRSIQSLMLVLSASGRDGLGRRRNHRAGPLFVDVLVVHLVGARPQVDRRDQGQQQHA